jgi:hypothetical protein
VTRSLIAAAAASLLFAISARAQEEAAAPTTYTLAEDGSATHKDTGAVCPAMIGDMTMAQVLTFDTEDKHLGITCQYIAANGFSATMSFIRVDEPGLVGPGDSAQRWNNSLYQILGAYPAALPANREGVEGDSSIGLRGALFTANGSGIPIRLGAWQIEDSSWQYRAQVTYVASSAETEWDIAKQTRDALIAAKAAADAS